MKEYTKTKTGERHAGPPEDFDTEYARAGSRCLKLLERILEEVTDLPADSSCGANEDDMNKLNAMQKQLFAAYVEITL